MKYIYNTLTHKFPAWLLLVVVCMGMSGCKKDLLPMVDEDNNPVYISLSTKSLNTGVAYDQINTVRVILMDPASNTVVLNRFVDAPTNPLHIRVKSGRYKVYVVANETPGNLENAALSSITNLSRLRAVDLPFLFINRHPTNIPMFGEVKDVTITAPAVGDSSPENLASVSIGGVSHGSELPVKLDRMASKLSITIKSVNKSLTSALLKQVPTSIPLFGDEFRSGVTTQAKTMTTLFTLTESTTDKAGHILECKDILIPSWMFADVTNDTEAMIFKFETPTGETFTIALGDQIMETVVSKDYTIKRNHNYILNATIKNKTMIISSLVEAWGDVELDIENDSPVVVPVP